MDQVEYWVKLVEGLITKLALDPYDVLVRVRDQVLMISIPKSKEVGRAIIMKDV